MRFSETDVQGVILIEPDVHRDARGFFLETYRVDKYEQAGIPRTFVQDNQSLSVHGTLRGLHMQLRKPQGKLLRVVEGEVWDVAVDLRHDSATFGRWTAATLSAENFRQLFIPPGCAHGFCVVSERAQLEYKCTQFYAPEDEVGIAWDDPVLAIRWPVQRPLLSVRDQSHPTLEQFVETLRQLPSGKRREPTSPPRQARL